MKKMELKLPTFKSPEEVKPTYTIKRYQASVKLPQHPLDPMNILLGTYKTKKIEVGYADVKNARTQTVEVRFREAFSDVPGFVVKACGWYTLPIVRISIPIPVVLLDIGKDKFKLWSIVKNYWVSYIAFER